MRWQLLERVRGKRYQEILLSMIDEKGNPMPVIDRTVFGLIYQGKLLADADNVVAINLSGNLINNDEFHSYILTQLQNYKTPVLHICFEITETAAIHSIDKAAVFINSLKSIGCQFALDDFGAGSSSFGYLQRLSVDYLKIDGIFVGDIEKDSFNRAMVEAVAQIGRVTGIAIIAEWVENEAVLDIIRSVGIDYAQGYALCAHVHWMRSTCRR